MSSFRLYIAIGDSPRPEGAIMAFYKKLFKTTAGKALLFGMMILSVALGIVFAVKMESLTLAFLWWLLATAAILLLFLMFMIVLLAVTDYRNLETSQEIAERVKVLNKRQICISDESAYFIDYITFEFPDGSSEELAIVSNTDNIFHSTNSSDIGILTYKVLTHHPRRIFTVHREGESRKKFVSFKKD